MSIDHRHAENFSNTIISRIQKFIGKIGKPIHDSALNLFFNFFLPDIIALSTVYAAKLCSKYRLQTAIKTDERVRLINEIISGIQVIKMYTWEKPFCALVRLARHLELEVITKSSIVRGLLMSSFLFITRSALYCTIVAMLMFGDPISADKIFVFASFYNLLSTTMTLKFAKGFAELSECYVSVARIQSFLMLDEFRDSNVTLGGAGKRQSIVIKEMEKPTVLMKAIKGLNKNSMNEIEQDE